MLRTRRPLPRPRLTVEPLEGRDVPAGNVTATLAGGVLTLTGDDQANVISTLTLTAGHAIIAPDAGTSINGKPPGTTEDLPATATKLTARLLGGNDSLTIEGNAEFVLTQGASFDLGEGDDTLTLSTTGKVQLGGLKVVGGEGNEAVTVRGGAGKASTIGGTTTFDFGPGASGSVTLGGNAGGFGELGLPAGGVRATAAAGSGLTLNGINLTTAGPVQLTGKPTAATAAFTGSTLGGVSVAGGTALASLTTTRVNGNLAAVGTVGGTVVFGGAATDVQVVTGDVSATGPRTATINVVSELQARNVRAKANAPFAGSAVISVTTPGSCRAAGDVTATGAAGANVNVSDGAFQAGNLRVTSSATGTAMTSITGSSLTLSGGLTSAGGTTNVVTVGTAGAAQLGGDLTATGGVTTAVNLQGGAFGARGVRAAGPGLVVVNATGQSLTLAGGLAATAGNQAVVTLNTTAPSQVGLDITVASAGATATVGLGPNGLSARDLRVSSPPDGSAIFSAPGPLTLAGGLTVTGGVNTQVAVGATGASDVGGDVRVTGATGTVVLSLPSALSVGGSVAVNTGNADGLVALGDGVAILGVRGGLSVVGGGGGAAVTLNRVNVGGPTSVRLGAGADLLSVEGSTFAGPFTADLGSGDDNISIAQDTGTPVPTTFNGLTTIFAGTGNDTLLLGKAVAAGGNGNSNVVFAAAGSKIDGGAGLNSFDDEKAQFTTAPVAILNWTDPTP